MATIGHIGSWGTPELGITEFIGDLFGKPRDTTTGGSAVNNQVGNTTPYTNNFVSTQYPTNAFAGSVVPQTTSTNNVLGASTSGETVPTGDTGTGGDPMQNLLDQQWNAYNQYLGELDNILYNDLPASRNTQEQIVMNSYNQGVNDLGYQKDTGLTDLGNERKTVEKRQVATLKDLSENIRAQYQAGNNYLGARGAGDSSATGMYSYALNKLGTKARGDIRGG